MKALRITITSLTIFCVVGSLSGCAQLQELTKKIPGLGGGKAEKKPDMPAQAPPVSGYWVMAFAMGEQQSKCSFRLEQQGANFAGEGTDDGSNREFTIEEGHIENGQVSFYKAYSPEQAIQFVGTVEMVNDASYKGPWMGGEFIVMANGQEQRGEWEAELQEAAEAQGGPPPGQSALANRRPRQPEQPQQPEQSAPEKAPHLSGKWDVAYEYDFKVIKSKMYLEQNEGILKGHGVDVNTNERFTIDKGWYSFPKITIIRKYVKGKKAASDRNLTFKGEVTYVKSKDYTGPHMSGKTQGGGDWEAQLVR